MKRVLNILILLLLVFSFSYAQKVKFPIPQFEFENMVWVLTKGNDTYKVKFSKGGLIEGYPKSDLVRWDIKDEMLILSGRNNSLAVKFDQFSLDNDGWTFKGVSLVDGHSIAVLKESSGEVQSFKKQETSSVTQPFVKTSQDIYYENQNITVEFYNLSGSQSDWITIVPINDPDNTFKEWYYTKGAKNGKMEFKGLPAGRYEVRAYLNWPNGGYNVVSRYAFTVVKAKTDYVISNQPFVKTAQPVYGEYQRITVEFYNLLGSQTDWITIVPVSDPDNTYKEWYYTKGVRSGKMEFNGLPAGIYEVRAYLNWPNGGYNVVSRYQFTVVK